MRWQSGDEPLHSLIVQVIRQLGSATFDLLEYLGQLAHLLREIVVSLFYGKLRRRQIPIQIAEIGWSSQPVIIVTGAFTGAVLAAQALFQFKQLGLENGGGALVSVAMFRELGPSITALMLAGRIGSGMAAVIGTMKVTEQIDALRSMAVHPIDFLVVPRVIAIVIAVPLLTAQSALFGITASYLVGVKAFGVPAAYWNTHVDTYTDITDIYVLLIKAMTFGLLIVVISCHQGLKASNGAVGVGRGTTRAMVFSSLAILIANLFLTLILNYFFPIGFAQ